MESKSRESVNKFFTYIIKQNFHKAFKACQITWKSKNSYKYIKATYAPMKIKRYEVLGKTMPGRCMREFMVMLYLEDGTKRRVKVRTVQEVAPYHPDVTGKWGVNPVSVFRGINEIIK